MDANMDCFLTSSEDAFSYAQALFGEITEPAPLEAGSLYNGLWSNNDNDGLISAMGSMIPFLPIAEASSFPFTRRPPTPNVYDLGCPCPSQLRIEEISDIEMDDLAPTPGPIPSPREAGITPEELEESRPLIVQRQKDIMTPLLKRAGRRRKNDLPHGTMVFQLPNRSRKRVKQIGQTQGPSNRTPRGKSCLLCSMRRVKCSIDFKNPTSPCYPCQKRLSTIYPNVCVSWEIEVVEISAIVLKTEIAELFLTSKRALEPRIIVDIASGSRAVYSFASSFMETVVNGPISSIESSTMISIHNPILISGIIEIPLYQWKVIANKYISGLRRKALSIDNIMKLRITLLHISIHISTIFDILQLWKRRYIDLQTILPVRLVHQWNQIIGKLLDRIKESKLRVLSYYSIVEEEARQMAQVPQFKVEQKAF